MGADAERNEDIFAFGTPFVLCVFGLDGFFGFGVAQVTADLRQGGQHILGAAQDVYDFSLPQYGLHGTRFKFGDVHFDGGTDGFGPLAG